MSSHDRLLLRTLSLLVPVAVCTAAAALIAQAPASVPKIWDDAALADWATPIAALKARPGHYTSAEYYAVPADNLRTYPVYRPDMEPPGYWEELQKKKPEPLVDAATIRTEADWIAAGARAFRELDNPLSRTDDPALIAMARDPRTFEKVPGLADGTVHEPRWVVTERGVMLTGLECASCHGRVTAKRTIEYAMPAAARPEGVGPVSLDLAGQLLFDSVTREYQDKSLGDLWWRLWGVPWDREHGDLRALSLQEVTKASLNPHGVIPRENGSLYYGTKVPDLHLLRYSQQPAAAAASGPPARPAEASLRPSIEWAELPPQIEMPHELRDSVRLGYLRVPQDHADPTGPTLRMAFAIVPALSPSPAPDPVVFIVGGPGLAGIAPHFRNRLAGPHPLDVLRERRNLIVFDQRGNGLSEPRTCRELADAIPPQPGSDSDAQDRAWRDMLASCRSRLLAEGVRLDTLSAVQVAHDLEWLRAALGAPQLNLIGTSYGSRIAAEAVRQFPAAIRAVHFSGPVPPGEYRVGGGRDQADVLLHTLFQRCAERPECRAAYPRLPAEYDAVLTRVREAPLRLRLAASDAGAESEILVDDRMMRDGLADLLLNRDRAAGVPLLIHIIYEHGDRFLPRMGSHLARSLADDPADAGTQLAFRCNDGGVTQASDDELRQRCRAWLGDQWDHPGAEPLQSDVPSLVETGELDPRTPPAYAHFLASGLTRAHLVIVPWYGHEAPSDCVKQIMRDFFDAPEQAPDTACLASIAPIPFVTGIVYSDWVGAAVARTWQRPWLAGLPGLAALLLLVSSVGIPVRHFRGRNRSRPDSSRSASLVSFLVTLVGLIFIATLAAAVMAGARRHLFVPAIGLPKAWAWVLALPWVLLTVTPVAAFLAVRSRAAGHSLDVAAWSAVIGSGLLLTAWVVNLLA
jgi:pimeloyl-ACP methyl ester carboxylesterase